MVCNERNSVKRLKADIAIARKQVCATPTHKPAKSTQPDTPKNNGDAAPNCEPSVSPSASGKPIPKGIAVTLGAASVPETNNAK